MKQGVVHGTAIENQVHDSSLDMKSNNMVRTTSDKQISRTFQGQITVFKDKDLLKKSAFFIPLLNTLLAKKTSWSHL